MYVEESAPIIITHWEWDAMEPASHAELFTNDASREGGDWEISDRRREDS